MDLGGVSNRLSCRSRAGGVAFLGLRVDARDLGVGVSIAAGSSSPGDRTPTAGLGGVYRLVLPRISVSCPISESMLLAKLEGDFEVLSIRL